MRSGRGGSPLLHHPALHKPEHPVGALGDIPGMCYRKQGAPLAADEIIQQVQNGRPGFGIQIPGRLVSQNQIGLVHQGPTERDALLLAAGESIREGVSAVEKADLIQQSAGTLVGSRIDPALELDRKKEILLHGQRRKQVEELEDEAQVLPSEQRPLALGELGELSTRDPDGTGVGKVDPADEIEQGGLAGTTGAQQHDELARSEGDAEVVENDPVLPLSAALPVGLPDGIQANNVRGIRSTTSGRGGGTGR